jgi:hypothetical protein
MPRGALAGSKKEQDPEADEAHETDEVAIVGQVTDFISGRQVRATAEEVEAVQVFARRLVEDYDYAKGQIQTHPQFRVRKRPSDEGKSYPVDIALFRTREKTEENLFLIVECKKKNRKDGLAQLKLYLDMSPAEIGVWFNGEDHAYLWKVLLFCKIYDENSARASSHRSSRTSSLALLSRPPPGSPWPSTTTRAIAFLDSIGCFSVLSDYGDYGYRWPEAGWYSKGTPEVDFRFAAERSLPLWVVQHVAQRVNSR